MYRKPQLKEQARILAKEMSNHGVTLAHRQALDILARMNGHASWHVMSQYEKASPATEPAESGSAVSVVKAIERDVVYTFEGVGFVADRTQLNALTQDYTGDLPATLQTQLEQLGFFSFCRVDISENDETYEKDIKVFISIRVVGPGRSDIRMPNEPVGLELANLLTAIAGKVCRNEQGTDCVNPEFWEIAGIDSL